MLAEHRIENDDLGFATVPVPQEFPDEGDGGADLGRATPCEVLDIHARLNLRWETAQLRLVALAGIAIHLAQQQSEVAILDLLAVVHDWPTVAVRRAFPASGRHASGSAGYY